MEFHIEKKREEGDRGDQEENRGSQKERDQSSLYQFPKCSPQPGHPKRFTGLRREEKGEGGDRGNLGRKRRVKGGNQASNHTPK